MPPTFCRDVSGEPADNHGFVYLAKAPASTMPAGAFSVLDETPFSASPKIQPKVESLFDNSQIDCNNAVKSLLPRKGTRGTRKEVGGGDSGKWWWFLVLFLIP